MASTAHLPGFGDSDASDAFSSERARATVAVCIAFVLLANLVVIARFWSRKLKGTKLALDDWLIVAGLVFYFVNSLDTILQVVLGGLGHHIYNNVSPDQIVLLGKLGTFNQYLYAFAMGFIRWSICHFLYRIFVTKWFRRAILTCIIVNILWMVFSIIIVSVRCIPYSKNWNQTEAGTCLEQYPIVVAVAVWGLLIEVAIWSLPIPAVWRLQMPRSNKVGLSLIFGLGLFDVGVGVARVVTILEVNVEDFTWTQVPALQWLAIEPSVAIIVACLCVCRPLMEKILSRFWLPSFLSTGRLRRRYRNRSRGGPGPNSGFGQDPRSTADDHVKLVSTAGSSAATTRTTAAAAAAAAAEKPAHNTGRAADSDTMISQTEPDDFAQHDAVHVRRDIVMSVHDKV